MDAVVSNPPYSQKWDSTNKETDPRYARFGLAPKSKADYAFLLHELYHLKPDGIMTIVLPHGVLFRGGEEGEIRKKLIEGGHIDAIIGLPANIFFGTGIPTIIIVLKQKRTKSDTLIVDASRGYLKVGKNNKLRSSDIKRIADTVIARQTIPNYSKVVDIDEIRENDYNLNIPRYVDSSVGTESWDLYASMFGGIPKKEIDALSVYWDAFPNLRSALFSKSTGAYASLKVRDVKRSIREHADVASFIESFAASFKDFDRLLHKEILSNMLAVNISKEEEALSEILFKRLASIPLLDKYEAYQILDDEWNKISIDLEIIQSEGFQATKKVDPNMVLKKKDGKDQEVQEGWLGRILPFELVQETLLKDEFQKLKGGENRLNEIKAECEELLESFNDDEKDGDSFNDDKDVFAAAGLAKEARQIRADLKKDESPAEDSYEAKILKADSLLTEEKDLKKELKSVEASLHLKTKATIEDLSDKQVNELLELKWITPLISALHTLPDEVIATLSAKVTALAEKYATTYKEVVEQIHETESSLSALIDELTGNDHDLKGLAELQLLLKGE
ncbi:hypothetical protein MASR2M78_20000 [Treponema sp.]